MHAPVALGKAASLATHLEEIGLRPQAYRKALDGRSLHARVGKERWCVTKKDLKHFRSAVKKAISLGLIEPTARDPFDPGNNDVGPDVYTVNDQFIKPVSALFGDTSWALMRHPHGLECDLFITHAWSEGMFEFLDKVLDSWPVGALHAYCCMLSNPQNLDISDLISNPSDSPFAVALRSASTLVVVPNHKSSIYSRLWCAYEAFLAVEKGMVIETASRRSYARALHMVGTVSALSLSGLVLGRLYCWAGFVPTAVERVAVLLLAGVATFVSMVAGRDSAIVTCNCVGAAAASFHFYYERLSAQLVIASLFYYAYFVLSELDRARRAECQSAAGQLSQGFSGSVVDAQCSSEADREAILRAIGDKISDVDFSIKVLRCAGMSSPTLCAASMAGVQVPNAGLMEFAYLAIKYPKCIYFAWNALQFRDPTLACLGVALVLLEGLWTGLLLHFRRDRRVLHLKIAHRMFVPLLPGIVLARVMLGQERLVPLSSPGAALCGGTVFCVSLTLAILLSALGVHRIARLPLCGPTLARLLVARSDTCCGGGKDSFVDQLCCPDAGLESGEERWAAESSVASEEGDAEQCLVVRCLPGR